MSGYAKAYLMRLRHLNARINTLLDKSWAHKEAAGRATSRLTATRVSGTSNHSQVEDNVIRYIMAEQQADRLIDEFVDAKREAKRLIEQIDAERFRVVLTARYIDLLDWEGVRQVMRPLYGERLSIQTVYNVHGYALLAFEKILENQNLTARE